MFGEIFRFELRQQLRSPLFWMIALAFGALAFGAAGSDSIQIGGGVGNVHRNAPYVVTQMLIFFTLLGMFLIAVFVAGAALRDFDNGTSELFFSTPIPRGAYLGGRFAAGYVASVLVMIVVALGLMTGVFMPWVDPERLGPTNFVAYGYAFVFFVLPGLFFVSALLFLLATATRSMLSTYIGIIAFSVLWQIAVITAGNLEHRTLGALIDPFGLGAFGLATRYWSAVDRNSRVPDITGILLVNRAIWIFVGALLIAAAFALFKPDREGLKWRRGKKEAGKVEAAGPAIAPSSAVSVTLATDASARWSQFLKLAWFDTRGVLRGVALIVMLAFGLINLGGSLAFTNQFYGTAIYPVTHIMTQQTDSSYNGLLFIIIAFYAGELVWRERSAKISEVTDAFPLPDWIPLLSKLVALIVVVLIFLSAGALECIGYQLIRGFTHIEPGLYLSDIALNAIAYLLLAVLALFFQVIANNKFMGYLLVVLFFISEIALSQLHFEHHLYDYGSAPGAPYSDMNGYGHFLAGHLWFHTYWMFFALGLMVVAALYWPRGTVFGWRERSRTARERFRGPARALIALSVVGFVALGVWIFYNTTVLNHYVPSDVARQRQADYEKTYRQYKDLPQPKITDVNVNVDIFPHERRVELNGKYILANKTDKPIDTLHMRLPMRMKLLKADFPAHDVVSDDRIAGYTIYNLREPLAPGATMNFGFQLQYWSQGFRNSPNDTRVVDNGTFLDSENLPHFGYDENGQLSDRNDRRKYGLPQLPRMPKIEDEAARQFNLLGRDADWVNFETTVSTDADQIALAPGYLDHEWTDKGRRYFHYKMDKPILNFFSFQSAAYKVKRDKWEDIALEVYYDPAHEYNVDRMMYAMKKSLAHFSSVYSPFQFHQMRILEFPNYESFAQSFANTVPFSESIGFIADLRDPDDIDYVFYVTAHELGHQWWAHQVIGAFLQGVTMLDETFAEYSALMVQEAEYGPSQMRKFLKYELDRYLAGRGGEVVEELPIALNENQQYIHYAKGSVVMYALKDYLGEETVDKVLSKYDHDKAFQQPPYTTTREFLDYLRADADPKYAGLIDDLFNKITVYDNRVTEAAAKKRDDGKYDVTLKLHTAKTYADGVGKETESKMDIPVDIGVFSRAPDGKERNQKVLYLQKQTVADGDSTITVTVDSEPYQAGIDPYNKLIDRVSDDNRMRVTLQ